MSAADGPVRLERDGPLAVVTLASPPLNLFDTAMFAGLRAAVDAVASEPPRGLLFCAEGRAVSGGGDVKVFDGLSTQDGARLWTELLDLVHAVEQQRARVHPHRGLAAVVMVLDRDRVAVR